MAIPVKPRADRTSDSGNHTTSESSPIPAAHVPTKFSHAISIDTAFISPPGRARRPYRPQGRSNLASLAGVHQYAIGTWGGSDEPTALPSLARVPCRTVRSMQPAI